MMNHKKAAECPGIDLLSIFNSMKDSNVILSNNKNEHKTMTHNEELVGGCCVCSDDQGFANNALVYCDGKGCTVACHTACYGIVSIPDGDWYCRRCEAGELQATCRLCPMHEGAMKRTSDGDWAHVICALYIPEVSFENNATMEPIILSKIPSTRYGQICSLCIKNGRTMSEAMKGACCQCSMKNCSQLFHVTCAQQAGFLYEDVRKNTCQYPIYCQEHQPKFSKFIRQIPVFHYKSSEVKNKTKEKINPSQLSDFVNQTNGSSSLDKKEKSTDETSQNSLTNLSQFVELNKEDRMNPSTINQHLSITDNNESTNPNNTEQQISTCPTTSSNDNNNLSLNTSVTSKIKTEENGIDYQIIEKTKSNKDNPTRKKRQHSTEGGPRPVGRPPKKTLLNQQKLQITSISPQQTSKPNESQQNKTDRVPIQFYPRRPLTDPTKTTQPSQQQQQRSFPPETLEEFLEQEWESSSDFLVQQSMPHDVSSLLSCLYQFKSENAALEKQYDELKHRRDSLRITNANLHRKLSELTSQRLPIKNSQKSTTKNSRLEIECFPNVPSSSSASSLSSPYSMIKNERMPPTNGLSLELLSQILTTSGPQLFAPTWNISNFGFANFPGANSISVTDESILRSYSSCEQ